MSSFRVLIVEDEILIADTIKRYLEREGYQVVGIAISFEEAIQLYLQETPDITLLDIRLNGQKSGIDVAQFIQQQSKPKPFIYLTSQTDSRSFNGAIETNASGYLTKPIQKESLYATIEISMRTFQAQQKQDQSITLYDGTKNHVVLIDEILYLQADHIYVNIHISNGKHIVVRNSLKEMLEQLPKEQFIQTHRSFAINNKKVNRWDQTYIYVDEKPIPISRSRRKEVLLNLSPS